MENYNPIINFWPEHIAKIHDFVQIDVAVDKELNLLWTATSKLTSNQYLTTMDESECTELETMLGILPKIGDTLDDRRRRIKGYFVSNLPYTQNKLVEVLNTLCGSPSGYQIKVDPANYKISVGVKLASVRLVENIEEMVNKMVPANMQREVWVMYNRWSRFKNVKWSTLKSYTWGDILSGSHWQE